MGMLTGLFHRFSGREPERVRVDAARWSAKVAGSTRISQAETRQLVKIAGVVERLRIRPQQESRAIEAVITDGTGNVSAVWLGRRSIQGLALGRRIVIEGRLADKDGTHAIVNPEYEFVDHQ